MPDSTYRHGAQHLKKRAKRASLSFKRTHNRKQPPPFAEIVPHYGRYVSRSGVLRIPEEHKPHYQVYVHIPSRYRLLYSTHRAPYHMYLSVTYDVEHLAIFRTRQAAINAAWRVFHQDEDWRAYVAQMER